MPQIPLIQQFRKSRCLFPPVRFGILGFIVYLCTHQGKTEKSACVCKDIPIYTYFAHAPFKNPLTKRDTESYKIYTHLQRG